MSHTLYIPAQDRTFAIQRVVEALNNLARDKDHRVEITRHRRTRSIQQCRYLNGIAYKLLGDFTGYDRDDISEYLCGEYFGWRDKKVPRKPGCDGTEKVPARTTTTNEEGERDVLSWADFDDYVAFVQRFGAEHSVVIPDPDPTLRKTG